MKASIGSILLFTAVVFALPQQLSLSSDLESLDAKFRAKGKKYLGTIVDRTTLGSQQNVGIARTEFGQVTAENRYADPDAISSPIRVCLIQDDEQHEVGRH